MNNRANVCSPSAVARKAWRGQRGMTLVETMMAAVILMIGILATMGTFAIAVSQNWNQGDRGTRATEYAQDKMEQLLSLGFTDTSTNTAVYPPTATGGTGLAAGGGVTPGSPVTGYVDYVDNTGTQTTAAAASYIRQWSISLNAGGNLETITVMASALYSTGGGGTANSTTVVCTKSSIQ